MSEDQKTYHVSELVRAVDERDQLQARCEELEVSHTAAVKTYIACSNERTRLRAEIAQQQERIGELEGKLDKAMDIIASSSDVSYQWAIHEVEGQAPQPEGERG